MMSSHETDTRTRILKATLSLLETPPAAPSRMSDIAKAAGISRQAVYLHFPNRAELLIAATRHLDEIHCIDDQISGIAADDALRMLDQFVDVWGAYIPQIYPVAKALMAMKDSDAAAQLAWQDRMTAVRSCCSDVVSALAGAARLTPDLSQKEAVDFVWTALSIRSWELLTQDCGWSGAEYITHIKHVLRKVLIAD